MHCVSHRTVSPNPWLPCARHPNHANHESSAYCILHQVVSPMIASAVMHLVYLLPENYASEIVQLRMRRQPVVGLACLPHACFALMRFCFLGICAFQSSVRPQFWGCVSHYSTCAAMLTWQGATTALPAAEVPSSSQVAPMTSTSQVVG